MPATSQSTPDSKKQPLWLFYSKFSMAKIYIAIHESELVVWTANILADILMHLTALSPQLYRALDGRNGHLSIRYLQATNEHLHKTLKLYDAVIRCLHVHT
ncbi:hypothetical protein ARMSODRAFT_1011247 [Armillaria solidipes]|uniref:Uncharacterized protein n=1 Tax=Armillaria solidipes TaxID=1076256 RepID=A0A2H3CBK1_9AGAR|nr:hypothetical protein ARMSODRAFT_1011247 [Armillaria solidipes]